MFLPLGVNDVRGQNCPVKVTHLTLPRSAGAEGGGVGVVVWVLSVCPLGSITLARSTADLPLRLVVEGKANRIPEGHQAPLPLRGPAAPWHRSRPP
jgi:hypothetical protein